MRDVEAAPVCSRPEPTRTESPIRALTFGGDPTFQRVLRERVAAYFATTGRRPRDCWQVYAKTAILLGSFAGLYALLVFGSGLAYWIVSNTLHDQVDSSLRDQATLGAVSMAAPGPGTEAAGDQPWSTTIAPARRPPRPASPATAAASTRESGPPQQALTP